MKTTSYVEYQKIMTEEEFLQLLGHNPKIEKMIMVDHSYVTGDITVCIRLRDQ